MCAIFGPRWKPDIEEPSWSRDGDQILLSLFYPLFSRYSVVHFLGLVWDFRVFVALGLVIVVIWGFCCCYFVIIAVVLVVVVLLLLVDVLLIDFLLVCFVVVVVVVVVVIHFLLLIYC